MKYRKKCISVLLAAAFTVSLPFTVPRAEGSKSSADDPCLEVDLEWINRHVPIPQAEIMEKNAKNGLCQIILKVRNSYIPLYAGKDFVLAGEMYAGKVPIARPIINHYKKIALAECIEELKTVVAIRYAPPKGSGKNIYMLTDPLCPHCNTAISHLAAIADETGVTFNIVFFNVHGKKGDAKVREAICGDMDFTQYAASEWKRKEAKDNICEKATALIDKTHAIVAKLGVKGVPLFLLEDSQVVSGVDMEALKIAIAKMNNGSTMARAELTSGS